MPVYYEADISGAGQATLTGGVKVQVVVCRLVALGPTVRPLDWPYVTDHVLRAGWIALGNFMLGATGGTAEIFWRPEMHLNFVANYFSPPAQFPTELAAAQRASHVRWCLAPDTSAHLLVSGA